MVVWDVILKIIYEIYVDDFHTISCDARRQLLYFFPVVAPHPAISGKQNHIGNCCGAFGSFAVYYVGIGQLFSFAGSILNIPCWHFVDYDYALPCDSFWSVGFNTHYGTFIAQPLYVQ